ASQEAAVLATEDLDVRAAAGTRAGNDVVKAVAIDVAGRHKNAAAEVHIVGVKAANFSSVLPVEDLDVRAAPRPGASNDIGHAIARDIARCHADAAQKANAVGEEVELLRAGLGIEDAHERCGAQIDSSDQDIVRHDSQSA